jgi:hypothetical protein
MKKIQLLAVVGLVLALSGVARAASDIKPASATVVSVQGKARYSTDGKAWHPLVAGKILGTGAIIETAANSSANLVLSGTPVPIGAPNTTSPQQGGMISMAPDPNIRGYASSKPMAQQNVIHMQSDTMLAIDKLTVVDTGADTVSDTELDLRAGNIFTSVKKMSATSQYIVKLPNGVAGIRGSSGQLGADGSASCLTGTVVVSIIGANGQPHVVVVHGGFGFNPQTGQVTALPPQVLAALNALGLSIQTIFIQISVWAFDLTQCFISPTQGLGHGGGSNNGGGGGQGNGGGGEGEGGGVVYK